MTVAAVVLAAAPASALADADGIPRARRIVESAWSGGALPVVVVSFDPDGAVATALAGAPATLAEPAPAEAGPAAQMVRGIEVAIGLVAETEAALVWPARMGWVGPETVTSLIEAHGTDPGAVLRPGFHGEAGWPLLVPLGRLGDLRAMPPDRMPPDIADALITIGGRIVDLGDPGTTIDGDTPRTALPPYEGPSEPVADDAHEWGATVAEAPEADPDRPAAIPYPGD